MSDTTFTACTALFVFVSGLALFFLGWYFGIQEGKDQAEQERMKARIREAVLGPRR